MNISLSPFAPEKLISREGSGSSVPRQPAHLHTKAESGAYSLSRFPRRDPFMYVCMYAWSSHIARERIIRVRLPILLVDTCDTICTEMIGTVSAYTLISNISKQHSFDYYTVLYTVYSNSKLLYYYYIGVF